METTSNNILSGRLSSEESRFEQTLRPQRFDEFIGQNQIKENLRIYVQAAKQRGEVLDHVLFSGPPGLGKTTLAYLIANELGGHLHSTTGPTLERPGDLVGILTNLERGDILFIDEVHRMNPAVEECLYSAMEDFRVSVVIDSGPSARSIALEVQRFTLVGATTREGLLTGSFRARFGVAERLDFYPPEDLQEIIERSASILRVQLDGPGAAALSKCSRGTPRIANRFLRRIRDLAQVEGSPLITEPIARRGLAMLGVDDFGLGELDRKILRTVLRASPVPVGIKTIALTVGEAEDTIEEVYEPFLIREGYLQKTPRGRMATSAARKVLGAPEGVRRLFEV